MKVKTRLMRTRMATLDSNAGNSYMLHYLILAAQIFQLS